MAARNQVSELAQLRRFVETLPQRIAALEELMLNSPRPPNQLSIVDSNPLNRDQLIENLTKWRLENGIEVPQRYLRNRSTAQLRKMLDQIKDGYVYRLGRRWKESRGG